MSNDPIQMAKSIYADMEVIESVVKRKGRFVGDMVHIGIADLATALRQHQQDGGWLPISEAPIRKWCLVTNGNDTIIAYRDWEDEDWDGGSYGAYAEVMETIRIKNPTHWMPLPPAPKKENDDAIR